MLQEFLKHAYQCKVTILKENSPFSICPYFLRSTITKLQNSQEILLKHLSSPQM